MAFRTISSKSEDKYLAEFKRMIKDGELSKSDLSLCTMIKDKESIEIYGSGSVIVPEDVYKKIDNAIKQV